MENSVSALWWAIFLPLFVDVFVEMQFLLDFVIAFVHVQHALIRDVVTEILLRYLDRFRESLIEILSSCRGWPSLGVDLYHLLPFLEPCSVRCLN